MVSLLEGLATTRAIRRYTGEPISDEDLNSILWHASRAPSGSNRQPFRFVVLRDGDNAVAAKALLGESFRAGWAAKRRADGYSNGSGSDPSSPKGRMAATMQHYVDHIEEVPVIVLACLLRHREANPFEGASIYPACQNMLLAARALGFGGALTMWHHAVEGPLRALLSIPDDVVISACITLGRPAGHHGPVRRLPLAELVYDGGWEQRARWAADPDDATFAQPGPPRDRPKPQGRVTALATVDHMTFAAGTLVAGVDSSTQSTKVEIRDLASGTVVGSGSAPHPQTSPPRSEQDPAAWWEAFGSAWEQAGSPPVAAISVGGQQHGMVVLDEHGAVIRDAKLWNDTETAADAAWLLKQLPDGAAGWAAANGTVPVAALTIAKLSWLHRSEPDNWARMAKVVLPHDYMTGRLTGSRLDEMTTDRGDASGTGYWSAATGEYCWDLLAIVDAERDWSTVVPKVLGPLEAAGRWGEAVVGPGTGDNMAAALGLGLKPGDAVMSLGTSGTVFTVSDKPTADASAAVAGFADASGRYLPLVCTLNATRVTDAVARLLGVDHTGLSALALAVPVGAGGVTLLPYFDGERTPNRPKATGWLTGLRSDVSREQLARAAFEGVVCGLLDGLDALRAHVTGTQRILLVGGGAKSAAYRQVLADLCDLPVVVADAEQAVAAGACVQAAAVLEQLPPDAIASRWGLGGGRPVERSASASDEAAVSVREAYAALRDTSS